MLHQQTMKHLLLLTLLLPLLSVAGCGDDDPIPPPDDGPEWHFYQPDNSGLPVHHIRCITIDEQGRKWLGTLGGGVAVFDDQTDDWTAYPQLGLIWDIYIDPNDIVWVGTETSGLWKFDGNTWTPISDAPDYEIRAIIMDLEGKLWVGTRHNGLGCYYDNAWTVYDTANSEIPANAVPSLAVDSNNLLWIGTAWNGYNYDRAGLSTFDGSSWQIFDHHNSALDSASSVYSITIDQNGEKWVGTSKGVVVFNGSNWVAYQDASQILFVNNSVHGIDVDLHNIKWIAAWVGGFSKFDGATWTTYDPLDYGISAHIFNDIVYDNDTKTVYVAATNGLIKFREVIN